MKQIKRHVFILLLMVTLISCFGCSGSNGIDNNEIPENYETGKDSGKNKASGETIRFLGANHMVYNIMIKPIIDQFEKETGITINEEIYDQDQLNQMLIIELTSGSADIDVYMTRLVNEKKLFYKNEWYTILDDYIKDPAKTPKEYAFEDFMPSLVVTASEDKKLVAVPLINEFQLLFYRKDLFEQKGLKVPSDFEELEAAAKKLYDPDKGIYGIVARGNLGQAVPIWGNFLFGYGGDFLKNGMCITDTPEAIESLEFYGRLLHDYGPPGVANMGWPQCNTVFKNGRAAMYTDVNSNLPEFTNPSKSKIADKVGVSVFPKGPKAHKTYVVSSWGLAISTSSAHKDAAWEFIKWVTSKENMKRAQLSDISTSRLSVWNDPEVNKKLLPQYAEVARKSAEISVPYYAPQMTAVTEAREILGEPVLKSILSGGREPLESDAKDAASRVNQLLKNEAEKGHSEDEITN